MQLKVSAYNILGQVDILKKERDFTPGCVSRNKDDKKDAECIISTNSKRHSYSTFRDFKNDIKPTVSKLMVN